jgi:aspartokinase-like uncharacterized kinase
MSCIVSQKVNKLISYGKYSINVEEYDLKGVKKDKTKKIIDDILSLNLKENETSLVEDITTIMMEFNCDADKAYYTLKYNELSLIGAFMDFCENRR